MSPGTVTANVIEVSQRSLELVVLTAAVDAYGSVRNTFVDPVEVVEYKVLSACVQPSSASSASAAVKHVVFVPSTVNGRLEDRSKSIAVSAVVAPLVPEL